ncbi:acyl-CoA thioester hydrolase/BAAT C-terminal domain-containing protein [Paraflavitalea sp. CAU 1676]|uniref:acyl-CoA thioester hydrolase/BAAT C-terminal domain-containing protein n=1 Tax=Paraflavitalea sp. CAU 1676 TaxID=3032598 RepID=UPI0023DA7230|nr:acyl-CoA thioester hydrolase/BAAT C-terminal domain-containing protein [Paraflavitalea sp. CAU 1676]MDF2191962.1 acyl-CoA thioester hydrolase/BAAT C-terminal domain-containing protein [Paraflavitalea sp. CAU 1676]
MRIHILACLLLIAGAGFTQPTQPADYGLKAFTIESKRLGSIHFYVSAAGIDSTKPLLIALDGSGHFPLATLVKMKKHMQIVNTLDFDLLRLANKFHIVLISKPGVQFCDTVAIESDQLDMELVAATLKPSAEYNAKAGLEWRTEAASAVIDYLYKRIPVNKQKIIAYGYSEGGQVVPRLAVINKKITHCASIVGSGLNQFYDWITAQRILAAKGDITHQEAQRRVDSLMAVFADIYQHPRAADKEWDGHTYLRWGSYGSRPALESLRSLTIPIFMAVGSDDKNSPIYGLDYVPLEFMRLDKHNLTYKVYPTDHFFNEHRITNGNEEVISHKQQMIEDLLKWIGN